MQQRDERTISAMVLRSAVELSVELGVVVEPILARHGISLHQLATPNLRLCVGDVLSTWIELARASGDPVFGLHMAQRVKLESLDVVGCAAYASENLRAAIGKILRYQRLVSDVWTTRVSDEHDLVRLERQPHAHGVDERHLVERSLGIAAWQFRRLSTRHVDPVRVCFRHAAPPDLALHREVFRCTVHFGTPANEMVYTSRDVQSPLVGANAGLSQVLDRYAEESLARLPPAGDYAERVRRTITSVLRGESPSAEAVARPLRVSARTLQRRLADEGTTLRELVDDVRRELAAHYLGDPGMSIDEVAFLLGFADTSSFHRAFHRWSDQTPAEYRDAVGVTHRTANGRIAAVHG